MQIRPIFLLSAIFLASCSMTIGPSTSEQEEKSNSEEIDSNTVSFYLNASEGEEAIQSQSKDEVSYFTPIRKGYCFDGWFSEKEGGEKYDFNSPAPDALYAHWSDYDAMAPSEKVARFISRIKDFVPKTGVTYGDIDTKYQSQYTGGYAYYLSDRFIATRYKDLVESIHYYPKYVCNENELSQSEIDRGETVESVNAKNTRLTVQDSVIDGNFVSLYHYNPLHSTYVPANNDYKTVEAIGEEEIEGRMSIDFGAYFLGGVNTMYRYLLSPSWAREASESASIEEMPFNGYYIEGLDPTEYADDATSLTFSMGYAITNSGADYSLTSGYQIKAGIALRNGKIVYANVSTVFADYIDDELFEVYESTHYYDFVEVSDYPEFQGERMNPDDFEEESE